MIRRVPVGLVANKDARLRTRPRRVRSLQLESLESRHTFCADLTELTALTAPVSTENRGEGEFAAAPFYGPMRADYYAQFPELPAQVANSPRDVVATHAKASTPAAVDEALKTLAVSSDEGEGEAGCDGTYSVSRGKAPRITEFGFKSSVLGGIAVFGQIEDEDSSLSSLPVTFYGALEGRATMTTRDGFFYLYIPKSELPAGRAQAQVSDMNGNKSDLADIYIR